MAWKTDQEIDEWIALYSLQWGHALMAWKTRHEHLCVKLHVVPSMGPRFNGVEDTRLAGANSPARLTFNGATL